MYLLTLVLNDPDLLEELLQAWSKIGVLGATVLYSTGLGRFRQKQGLRDDMPLFPSLDDFYEGPQAQTLSRTIFTVLKDEGTIEKIVDATQGIVGDLNLPESGVLFITPVLKAYGLEKTGRTK
jgi:nitrogen regulatory protein PII